MWVILLVNFQNIFVIKHCQLSTTSQSARLATQMMLNVCKEKSV